MIKVTCPHKGCKCLLKKTDTGALKCPKCGCVFRVIIAVWNTKCFIKHHPHHGQGSVSISETRKKYKKKKRKKRKKTKK